jgi:hypothetical protein
LASSQRPGQHVRCAAVMMLQETRQRVPLEIAASTAAAIRFVTCG